MNMDKNVLTYIHEYVSKNIFSYKNTHSNLKISKIYRHIKLLLAVTSEEVRNSDFFNTTPSKKKRRDDVIFITFHVLLYFF